MAQLLPLTNIELGEPHLHEESGPLLSPFVPEQKVTRKFPKSSRLLTSAEYKFFHRHSTRLFGLQIAVDIREGKASCPRLGVTVSRKFGKAHDRNRFKRVVREAFREISSSLPQNLELNISPRNNTALLTKQAILVDLKNLLAKFL